MGVDHRGFDVCVAEQFLNGSNIVAILEHMRGIRVTEGVTGGVLDNSRLADGLLDGALERGLMHVMLSLLACVAIHPPA
jgi:hypothetical protein